MTQGAPKRAPRTTKAAQPQQLVVPDRGDELLDLDEELSKLGLLGERRVKIGGQAFRFVKSATMQQLTDYNAEDKVVDAIAVLLFDPSEKDELVAAFERQRQPILAEQQKVWTERLMKFILGQDAGESSAS
ncbi:hypothetical protein [Amycolatopsis sp. NPDC059657]|uniref:hypothetical protein n=1 Tax=Amycolatopsis sp. NPDC059657 TaxID=3346899 RepID=UPI003672AB13